MGAIAYHEGKIKELAAKSVSFVCPQCGLVRDVSRFLHVDYRLATRRPDSETAVGSSPVEARPDALADTQPPHLESVQVTYR